MFAAVALALGGCSLMPHVEPHARSMPDMLKAAARIQVDCTVGDPFEHGNDFDISVGFGSAVVTDERHMMTAWHVIKCQTFPTVYAFLSDGRRIGMLVDKEDQQHDLARLRVMSDDRFHLDIAPPAIGKRPAIGETICSMATTPAWRWSCGEVGQSVSVPFAKNGENSTYDVEAKLDTKLGNSGAGVYDSRGALAGLVTGHCVDDSCAGVMSLEGRGWP